MRGKLLGIILEIVKIILGKNVVSMGKKAMLPRGKAGNEDVGRWNNPNLEGKRQNAKSGSKNRIKLLKALQKTPPNGPVIENPHMDSISAQRCDNSSTANLIFSILVFKWNIFVSISPVPVVAPVANLSEFTMLVCFLRILSTNSFASLISCKHSNFC